MSAWNAKANDIFLSALEIESPDQRRAYVQQACNGHADLLAQVQTLLAASESAGNFLESPPSVIAAVGQAFQPAIPRESPGTRIGPYKLLQQIGEGGFGVVYMAEQQIPVRRKVALKIIKPGMDTKEVIARFESERQALALMDHPNIAKVLDAGTVGEGTRGSGLGTNGSDSEGHPSTPNPEPRVPTAGRPYFVMELVKGVPITEYCDSNHLPAEERLELFIQVCNALQHAHQKGIIHRDLKPSNVMVTMHDGRPVPKVIDFGVAKATSQTLTERTLFTAYGQMIGTPAYMSPEQAEMSCLDVDTRSDVYSLGVLLYELLTGTTPFEAKRLREAGYAEMARIIKEEEPESVSTRIAKIRRVGSAHQTPRPPGEAGTDAKRWSRRPGEGNGGRSPPYNPKSQMPNLKSFAELDWIVARSLEKDRERRYESASAFARDVRRYLTDETVQACPPSAIYRFRKFARKNRGAITTAAVIAASLLICTALSTWLALRALAAEAQATAKEAEARAAADAERSAKEAESLQRRRAENSEQEAKGHLLEVKKGRRLAEENLDAAFEALHQMLAHVEDDELNDIPRVGPLRRKMLKDAISFYERIPLQSASSADSRLRMANLWIRVAELSWNVDEYEQARDVGASAIANLERLVEEQPTNVAFRKTLADTQSWAGTLMWWQFRNFQEAERQFKGAEQIFATLAYDQPAEPNWLLRQVDALTYLGGLCDDAGKTNDAIEILNRALDVLSKFQADTEHTRASIWYHLAMVQRSFPEKSDELFRQSIDVFRKYQTGDKATQQQRVNLAHTLRAAASRTNFAHRQPVEAERMFGESIAILREVCGLYPARGDAFELIQSLHAQMSLLRLRSSHLKRDDIQSARELATRADKLVQEMLLLQRRLVARFVVPADQFALAKMLQAEAELLLNRRTDSDEEKGELQPEALLAEAVQLCRALVAEFEGNADYKSRLADLEKLQAQHFGDKPAAAKGAAP